MTVLNSSNRLKFKPAYSQTKWTGRYGRIAGNASVFKIIYLPEYGFWPVIQWENREGQITCPAQDCDNLDELVEAVNMAKKRMSGGVGGSFCINEFGQIIVPSGYGDGNRLLVGEVDGVIIFEDDSGNVIDLSDDESLKTGDYWNKPYVGMQYNLSKGSKIYHYLKDSQRSDYLPVQDEDLVSRLRKVRRYGAVRFIVNPYGLVLTKVTEGEYSRYEENWVSVYVGKINKKLWFRKES